MAFQPIFDLQTGSVFAQEALVRGKDGRSAGEIFAHVTDENRYQFDQRCRTTAIEVATNAGLDGALSINFMPNAVYEPSHCISHTLRAAEKCNFDTKNLIFEFTESEPFRDIQHIKNIVDTYKQFGFRTAIDDFGAGYAGLALLAEVVPDIIKLDRALVANCDTHTVRQSLVANITALCRDLGILVIAEGIETDKEFKQIRDLGIHYIQGYHLARPQFERLQTVPDVLLLELEPKPSSTGETVDQQP